MEVLNEAIKKFLTVSYNSGYGDGSGYGYGDGSGYGSGDGDGDGSGSGDGLISFNNNAVHYIDYIPTVIEKVRNNLAKGYIISKDLTTESCYVVKHGRLFAHGATVREAEKALSDKVFNSMNVDEKIEAFLSEFNLTDAYPASTFYDWHNKLTGSCEMGRNAFVKNHDIDLENDTYTVKEFIELTENDYGRDIIKKLKERIEK